MDQDVVTGPQPAAGGAGKRSMEVWGAAKANKISVLLARKWKRMSGQWQPAVPAMAAEEVGNTPDCRWAGISLLYISEIFICKCALWDFLCERCPIIIWLQTSSFQNITCNSSKKKLRKTTYNDLKCPWLWTRVLGDLSTDPLRTTPIPVTLSPPADLLGTPSVLRNDSQPSEGTVFYALKETHEDPFFVVIFTHSLVGFHRDKIMGVLSSRALIWFTSSEDVIGSNQNEVSHFRKSPLCSKT